DLLGVELRTVDKLLKMKHCSGDDIQFMIPVTAALHQRGTPLNLRQVIFQRMPHIMRIALDHLATARPVIWLAPEPQPPYPAVKRPAKEEYQNTQRDDQVKLL